MATKTYREIELRMLAGVIESAREMWARRCAGFVLKNGDKGSAVLGAHIAVSLIPSRCRRARSHKIIDVPGTAAQGASTWEESVEDVLRYLRDRGVDAYYEPGHMD